MLGSHSFFLLLSRHSKKKTVLTIALGTIPPLPYTLHSLWESPRFSHWFLVSLYGCPMDGRFTSVGVARFFE